MKSCRLVNRCLFLMIALCLTESAFLATAKDVYGHATGPVIVFPQTYHMQPGQTLTQDMRICFMTGGNFAVNNITFRGNSSSWAKVDVDLPVRAVGSLNAPSSLDIPVTITVPSNFTDKFSVIQTVVDVQTPSNLMQ